MRTDQRLGRVPWTCLWGRFAETDPLPRLTMSPRFVFWTCAKPDGKKCLTRDSCKNCVHWRPTSSVASDTDELPISA